GDRAAGGVGAHPLDGDGPGTAPHVPQQFPGGGREGGEGGGADVPFGELAVVFVGRVRESGDGAEARGAGGAPAVDGDDVERVAGLLPAGPVVGGRPAGGAFAGAAELLQDAHPARSEAAVAQQGGDVGGRGGVGAEHEQAPPVVQGGGEAGGGAADEGDDVGVLHRPGEAGAGEGDGGGVRQDVDGAGSEEVGEGASDCVEHGVAAGEDGDAAAGVRVEQAGDGGPQRGRPGDPLGAALGGQQRELARAADHGLGVEGCGLCGGRQCLLAVGAAPDHGRWGGRSWSAAL